MQHEKPGKIMGPHAKLDQLEELPGEPAFDAAAAWGRLERRLDQPDRPARRYLLWAAACLLLLAGTAAWLAYQPAELPLVLRPAPPVQQPPANSSNPVVALPPAAPVQQPQDKRRLGIQISSPKKPQQGLQPLTQPEDTVTEAMAQVEVPTEAAPAASAASEAAVPRPRKLKVVHLNELGTPPQIKTPTQPGTLLAGAAATPAQRQGRAGILFSRNTSDDFIKINISPAN